MNTNTEFKTAGAATVTATSQVEGYTVKGFMTLFNIPDLVGDITKPGAFTETIQQTPQPPLLWQHDTSALPAGKVKAWAETADGVFFIAHLADTTLGKDLQKLVKMGAVTGVSYGYNVQKAGTEHRSGKRYRTLEKVKVLELSLVNFPAHPDARLAGPEGKDLLTIGEVECLQKCGRYVSPGQLLRYADAMSRRADRVMAELNRSKVTVAEIDLELDLLTMDQTGL